ncbi:M20 metallopeptidase family protein [Bariatricus sp. SGI.161]|uniref:M20 metallopeptidase family protein n=1 Tax=Lachnospiraceae TaxID=186803 RepID=UPI002A7CFCE2|nr:M20 family metallopeptidase [Blautia obeum]
MKNQIMLEAEQIKEEMTAWRRKLHQIPEIGLKLPKTVQFVKEKLDEMGIEYTVYEESSNIVACIGHGDTCYMIRGDMDALPMEEKSGETFSSTNGCMHACGHDMHTAMMLGAAKLIKAHESELKGVAKLLFQSAEEIFAGAKAAITSGVMENPHVDAAMALHVFSQKPLGTLGGHKLPAAGVYGFRIKLTGQGVHGSSPEHGVDPINTAIHIHLGLQELISREVSGFDEVALTIGKFHAGSAANIIPETAELEGTLRVFDPVLRQKMIQRIHTITQNIAEAYRTKAEIEVLSNVPPLVCDEAENAWSREVIYEVNNSLIIDEFHAMGSEDFAFYSELVPATFYMIGAGVENPEERFPQHNPKIRFNEDVLPIGAAVYTTAVLKRLSK